MRKKSGREEVGELDGRRQWDGEWAVKERKEGREEWRREKGKKEGREGRDWCVRVEGTKEERMGQLMKSTRAHQILAEPADTEGRL